MNFKEELSSRTEKINGLLRSYLPKEEGFARALAEAMNYSMNAGGKRLRPLLMWECYRMFGGEGIVIQPFMAAIEMIHTHSLIHDDLPAIDNDRYRRGRETTWAVYGESMGILSGDALLNYAYEAALHAFDLEGDKARIALALQVLSAKTGIYGMLGGQSVDVANDGKPLSEELLSYIYRNKTSALLEASMMVGAILAGASDRKVRSMEQAAGYLGLAFQIRDDILDVTSSEEVLGKPVHSDEKNHKVTYVTLKGLEQAREDVSGLTNKALMILDALEEKNEFLRLLVLTLAEREK
ncbi:MAG: polyprenyl synthetase family protein [Blautia sp.]